MCDACGLSVFVTEADARTAQALIPGMAKKRLARGKLDPQMGRIKDTSEGHSVGHHTWWLTDGLRPASWFRVIA